MNSIEIKEIARKKACDIFVPTSVYRLQLNPAFNFKNAKEVLAYLQDLGCDAAYFSPYFQATKGSSHGYDVTDPNRINPDLGGEKDYEQLCEGLEKHKLGHIMDLVPNHMGISRDNLWWMDVLENGRCSLYSDFFDIDWAPEKKELVNKVLLPVLGDQYGKVLDNQEIKLVLRDGRFYFDYWAHCFPVAPDTYPCVLEHGLENLEKELGNEDADFLEFLSVITAFKNLPPRTDCDIEKKQSRHREIAVAKNRFHQLLNNSKKIQDYVNSRIEIFNGLKGMPESFDHLEQMMNQQSYRLSYWRVAAHEINYRRFFNINELAAIRNEDDHVFKTYHELVFKLVRTGKVQGLRIDHPDGLYDPPAYFRKLQKTYLVEAVIEELLQKSLNAKEEVNEEDLRGIVEEALKDEEMSKQDPLYIVVEKILDRKETLPEDWDVL